MPPLRTIKIVPVPFLPPAVATTSSNAAETPATTQENLMSLFSVIEGKAKTFAHDFEEVYVKLFQAEPKIEQAIVGAIGIAAPLVVAIALATGSEPEAAAITAVISVVKSDLAVIQTTLNAAGAGTPNASVKSTLTAIVANLGSLLTVGMVKNPATLATITKDVTSISGAFEVVIAAL
jgi:hypothetical protein